MKSLFLLFLLVFLPFWSIGENLQVQFNHAIDYLNCKVSELSLKKQSGSPHLEAFYTKFGDCNPKNLETDFYDELDFFLEEQNLTETRNTARQINEFKKGFYSNFSNSANQTNSNVYSYITNDVLQSPTLKRFESRHKASFQQMKIEILSTLAEYFNLSASVQNQPIEDDDYSSYRIPTDEQSTVQTREADINPEENTTADSDTYSSSWISRRDLMWLFLLAMFVLLGFYFIRSVLPKYNPNSSYMAGQIDDEATQKLLENLVKEVKDLKEENLHLNEEFEVLRYRIDKIDQPTAAKSPLEVIQSNNEPSENPLKTSISSPIAPTLPKIFYLPKPSAMGEFKVANILTEFKRGTSVYRFNLLSEDGTQAEFALCEDIATMIRALDAPEDYLQPACRSNTIIPVSATKVITDEKGRAILDDDEWRVVRKALIRYF